MSEGMRRRKAGGSDPSGSSESGSLDVLNNFDIFNKVNDIHVDRKQSGGLVTLATMAITSVLLWSELRIFFSIEIEETFTVDTRVNQAVTIKLDVEFPHMQCDDFSVAHMDIAGDMSPIDKKFTKTDLDLSGQPIPKTAPPPCGSCFAAQVDKKCCNTCEELKAAYSETEELSYSDGVYDSPQCKGKIGCRLKGSVAVRKIKGNIHMTPGRPTATANGIIHAVDMEVLESLNTTHSIHELSFGPMLPDTNSPLNGHNAIANGGAEMFHYFIKLVPTLFVNVNGSEINTNQLSVHDTSSDPTGQRLLKQDATSSLPGLFFVYDFSPFIMSKVEKTKPWSYIFTSMCAIIGGLFSIAALVELLLSSICGHGKRNSSSEGLETF